MILTEKEARTKWCPHVRVVEGDDDRLHGPFNRYHSGLGYSTVDGKEARCLASDCMAWRWAYKEVDRHSYRHDFGKMLEPVVVRADKDTAFCGFCGLSGVPLHHHNPKA